MQFGLEHGGLYRSSSSLSQRADDSLARLDPVVAQDVAGAVAGWNATEGGRAPFPRPPTGLPGTPHQPLSECPNTEMKSHCRGDVSETGTYSGLLEIIIPQPQLACI
jgi:hypothetical protein